MLEVVDARVSGNVDQSNGVASTSAEVNVSPELLQLNSRYAHQQLHLCVTKHTPVHICGANNMNMNSWHKIDVYPTCWSLPGVLFTPFVVL